jgi:Ca2+-binding RTX toxin-like protein
MGEGPVRPIGSFSVLAIAGMLAFVGSASASTLAVDRGGTLRFSAGWWEANHVNATDVGTGGATVVTDPGSIIHVGNGCVQVTPHEGSCPLPANFEQDLAIYLGDRNDFAHAFKLSLGHIAISGGTGADTIEDLPELGADVSGGPGDDEITVHPNFGGVVDVHGDSGRDTISAISASGVVDGDSGDDQITLTTFVEPSPGASAAYGGWGDDTISAEGATSMGLIDGGVGDDTVTTGALALVAEIRGGFGADEITSLNGTSQISGGFGPDSIDGGGEGDTINCGFGIDKYVQYAGDTVSNCEIAV